MNRRSGRRAGEAMQSAAQAAAYLARRRYGYSSAEIAKALGYRGHSSVGAAVRARGGSRKGSKCNPGKTTERTY